MTDKQRIEDKILFSRKLKVGYTKATEWDKTRHPIFVEAQIKEIQREQKRTQDLKPIKKFKAFSISGHSRHFGGQIQDELTAKDVDFAIPKARVQKIKQLWKQWHLSDLKAGTKKQEEALKGMKGKYDYEKAVAFLQKRKLHKDRGYQYGTAWLVDPLPKGVEAEIMKVFGGS